MWAEAKLYSGMAWGLVRYQAARRLHDPVEAVKRHVAARERHFLAMARWADSQPGHPYAVMFRLAGCSYADLETGIRREGLESTLRQLLKEGVYLTLDEFRGRVPVVRRGREIPSHPAVWNNPGVRGLLLSATSGSSTGARLLTTSGVDLWVYREAYEMLEEREFGYRDFPRIRIAPILPAGWGIAACVMNHRFRRPVKRWFAVGGGLASNAHYRSATRYMVMQSRLLGARVPYPEYLAGNDFAPVAEEIARSVAANGGCYIAGGVSSMARVAAAAADRGLDLTGTHVTVSGEPLTDAKRKVIESSGARVFPRYMTSDYGFMGFSCRAMDSGNCVHQFRDNVALVQPDAAWNLGPSDSIFVTVVHPMSPRILINAELGDRAVIEPAHCDCEFSHAGLTMRIRDIAAIAKVTGAGATFIVTDLARVLEEALPARFGGRAGDYQVAEVEGKAQTEILLRVSPRVPAVPLDEIRDGFLGEIRRLFGGSLTVNEWKHAGAVQVRVEEPEIGSTGKVASVKLIGPGTGARW